MHRSHLTALAMLVTVATAPAQIWVSPTGNDTTGDGSQTMPYATISHAISVAVSGDVIQLTAGSFEDDEITTFTGKDLTLVGAGVGQTTLVPHPTLTTSIGGNDVRPVLLVEAGARLDVRDLTIDGDFRMPSSGRLYGVFYHDGADGTVSSIEVTNCRADPLTGAQGPQGILIDGDSTTSDTCVVAVRDCYVHDFGKNGITARDDAIVEVVGCRIVGAGPVGVPLPAQNGVQISFGATGEVRRNVIAEIAYTPASYTATGILPYDFGAGLVIEDNHIVRCETALYAIQSTPGAAACDIRRNVVSEGDNGILNTGTMGVSVVDNVIATQIDYAYDDTAGNTWSGNNYGDYDGSGSYAIEGGVAVDTNPRTGHDGFGAATAVALGDTPADLVVADLDGTGELDFATANDPASGSAMPTLSIGLQGMAGSFTVSSVSFGGAGARPAAITTGEFDGQPGVDLAVVTENENMFYVFANDGAGTFTLASSGPLPAGALVPADVTAGDFDGDGDDDLAVATRGGIGAGGGAVLTNDLGSWSGALLPGTFTTDCLAIAAGTLDADATVDLVLLEGDASSGLVHVYSNTGGVFSAIAGSPFAVDAAPTSAAIGDLDGDGDNDIALTSNKPAFPLSPGSATVLVNDLPAGFSIEWHNTGVGPASIAIGDLGQDSDPDTFRTDAALINLVDGDVSVLADFGAGGFAANQKALSGGGARAVAIADSDGDGYGDLVVADAPNQRVLILPGIPRARIDVFGTGCAGTEGLVPQISSTGAPAVPTQPNLTLGIGLSNARPNAVAVLFADAAPAPVLAPCGFLLNGVAVTWGAFTTGSGTAGVSLPVPSSPPSFVGGSIYFQWVVLDPNGGFASLLSMSRGLKLRVGY